jgi:hypothetical protein
MSRRATDRGEQKFHISYDAKIGAISTYFGVSDSAAKYMYHLRRKGFPYCKPDQKDFLPWSTPLQNALVRADTHETFKWGILQFGDEELALMQVGIDINEQEHVIFRNDVSQENASNVTNVTNVSFNDVQDDGDGWTVVNTKDKLLAEKHILRSCGLLPSRTRKPRKKNYPGKTSEIDNNPIDDTECGCS